MYQELHFPGKNHEVRTITNFTKRKELFSLPSFFTCTRTYPWISKLIIHLYFGSFVGHFADADLLNGSGIHYNFYFFYQYIQTLQILNLPKPPLCLNSINNRDDDSKD